MRLLCHILLFALLPALHLDAQRPDKALSGDSIRISLRDKQEFDMPLDAQEDTIPPATRNFQTSPSALAGNVEYNSNDSMRFDNARGEVYLYGNAYVKYQTFELKANYIIFNLDSSIAVAQGFPDSTGHFAGFPEFKSADQSFTARKLRYNFQTRKGKIYNARTQQADLYILGAETKFVGAKPDSVKEDDYIYNTGALITTCDAPIPHYGIRSSRIKTIPNKLAVIGPSNLEIMGVPTPLWLPFGFFPVSGSRRSGLIFPRDYEYSDAWGFGLRDIGYYIPINDYVDAKILGDIYFNGSWALGVNSTYRKRYAFSGSINIGYSSRKNESAGELNPATTKSFSIRISHTQDPKAHPYRRLGGSINIQTNDYQSLNRNDANSVLTSVYTSNFSWSRTFPGKPYSLSLSLNHSQNTRTKEITIDAPNLDFRLNRIYPFKSKTRVGKEKWYEKIGFQYSGNARSKFITTDSQIFTDTMWNNAQYGAQHRANADLSFTLAKYFHVTPSANYEETWFFKTQEQHFEFNPSTDIVTDTIYDQMGNPIEVPDTISYGHIDKTTKSGFTPFRRFSSGVSVTTQIFGTIGGGWHRGWLRGIRHVIKPAISFNYTPDLFDKFRASVQADIRQTSPDEYRNYSILERGVYSASFSQQHQDQMALGYSFNNIFEAKYFSRKDSTEKKLKLFDNIVVNGNYNFFANGDSLNFSPMNINGTTRLFKGASTLSFSAMYDFYDVNEDGRRYQKFYWENPGKLLRFDNFQLRVSTRMTIGKIKELFTGTSENKGHDSSDEESSGDSRSTRQQTGQKQYDQFFNLLDDFSIDHNFSFLVDGKRDTTIVTTHTINMRGALHLTKKWSINVGNIGYDLRAKRLTYPDIGFTRDLHCWSMSMSWQPQRGTYALRIGVKPGSLDFIKIPHNRNLPDTFGGF